MEDCENRCMVALSKYLSAALTVGKVSMLGSQKVKQHHKPSHSQQHRGNKPDRPTFFCPVAPLPCCSALLYVEWHRSELHRQGELFKELTSGQKPPNSKRAQKLEQANHLSSSNLFPSPFKVTSFHMCLTPPFPLQKVQKVSGEKKRKKQFVLT